MRHSENVADAEPARNAVRLSDARPREAELRLPIYVLRSKAWRDLIEQGGHAAQVLLLLLGHARSAPGGKLLAWVPIRRLADLTAAWRKTVYASLKLLKEQGWIVAQRERGPRRGDEYTLAFPGDAGEVHAQVLSRLSKKDGPSVTSPLFQDGDLFFWNGAWHIREARIPVSTLGSWLWAELRRASPQAMHVYLLVVAYSLEEAQLGMTRLAREARVHKSRLPDAIALLKELQFLQVTTADVGKRRGRDTYTVLPIESPLARSPELDPEASAPPRPAHGETCDHCGSAIKPASATREIEGVTSPPADLVALLDREVPGASGRYRPEEIWEYLRAYGFWPRREKPTEETLGEAARRMVVEFHRAVRGAEGYAPTVSEVELAETIARRYGHTERGYGWFVLRSVLLRMAKTKFVAGHLGAVRRYLAEVEHDYPEVVLSPNVPRPDPSS